ncbi:MAG: Unknown protein, partial [uncultured Aureispira sp.]
FQDEMALGWSLVIMSVSSLSIATVLFYFALRSAGKDEAQEVGENILDS